MRRLSAAMILLTGLLGPALGHGQTSAQSGAQSGAQTSLRNGAQYSAPMSGELAGQFRDFFASSARHAGQDVRDEGIRQQRIVAAISLHVAQFLVERPAQIDAIFHGLAMGAPNAARAVAHNAMLDFPGFSAQIGRAAGIPTATIATAPGTVPKFVPSVPRPDAVDIELNALVARAASGAVLAIAQHPDALEQIMREAMAAAPGGAFAVVQSVHSAYPGFSRRIAAATGTAAANAPTLQLAEQPPARPTLAQPAFTAPPEPEPISAIVMRQTETATQPETAAPSFIPGPAPDPGLRLADDTDDNEISDPWEPMNRIFFAFNETIDLVLLRPIAIGYDFIMPGPVKTSVRRFFLNLDAPVILANDLLQGDLRDAGVTVSRFGINSTIGVLGLFDPAASFGLDRHHADFGQTLHSYNVGAGPYLVLPLLGPASTRGGVGKVVDIFFQPLTYILTTGQNLALTATRAVVKREELLEPLDELRENSIDYYTGLKAAYWQTRQVELNKGTLPGHAGDGTDQLFDAAN